ncbi:unnamed protein product [Acanthoscelides obtectus]|uniref:Uncharacterized protein n=1 Tax=Acanthoscelides obtectus TaxID=200917 RepID=A0A9P0JPX5_ACAOB|nr:unnamed protein product [Acanthoscelides obtectus]CAK1625930.1 hypothetical protein AOBTE_LOCUS3477 [Acanthoscelides obtectus]
MVAVIKNKGDVTQL